MYFNLFVSWVIFLLLDIEIEKRREKDNKLREENPHLKSIFGEIENESSTLSKIFAFFFVWFFVSIISSISQFFWYLIF